MQRYDLIIVGGGLVGAGLAAALHQSGLNIALIDAKQPSSDDPRLFALNSTSCQFLANLNLWQDLAKQAAPIHQVHVSHQGRFGCVRLRREEVNLSALGNVVPARYIEAALNERLQAISNCTIYRPATLKKLTQGNDGVTLVITTEHGELNLQAPLVVGADGTESTVRTQLGIQTDTHDYQQGAIVTRTRLARSHHHIAHERFNAQGAIAMLPLPDHDCASIWSADTETIAELRALSDSDYLQRLQREFGYRLGRIEQIGKRHYFPLRMVRAQKALDQGVLLLGNAAHTLHPVAAQGFNLAIYEVAVLAEAIMEKVKRGEVFSPYDLQGVNNAIQQQTSTSIGVSHRLSCLFASDSSLLGVATQFGMIGLNITPPIKKRFIEGILGKAGRVPRLLLGK